MLRAAGIDAGTVSLDLCVLEDGRPVLERTLPTADALRDPFALTALLDGCATAVLAAGYGLPLVRADTATDDELTLAFLPDRQGGGIGGLRRLVRALAGGATPVWLTPGVVHLPTVPRHRTINRIDLGTADKVATAALALATGGPALDAIVLEMGGAFTAALALEDGRIVDGIGGSSGPLGARAGGALDGEVAVLLGTVTKAMLFEGGAASIAERTGDAALAHAALVEGAVKAVRQLQASAPAARRVLLAGRTALDPHVGAAVAAGLGDLEVRPLVTLGGVAKAGAQGAAVLADGLAGGRFAPVVAALALREARGTVLDGLMLGDPAALRARLGLA